MSKRNGAAMRLHRETVRELTEELDGAVGGMAAAASNNQCSVSYLINTCGTACPQPRFTSYCRTYNEPCQIQTNVVCV